MATPKNKKEKVRGRPRCFKSVKDLQEKIDEYFDYCDNRLVKGFDSKTGQDFAYIRPEPYTMSGLAYYLKIDRKTLVNYSHRESYFPTIKRARAKVEWDLERRLNDRNTFTAGLIFNLKENYGWKDKHEAQIEVETFSDSKLTYDQLLKKVEEEAEKLGFKKVKNE